MPESDFRRAVEPDPGGWPTSAIGGEPDANHDLTVDHIPGFFAPSSDPTLLMLPCPLSDRKDPRIEKLLRCEVLAAGLAAGSVAGSVRASSPEGARSRLLRLGVVPGEAEPL